VSVVLNGSSYSSALFYGTGYRNPNAATNLPNFPDSIFTDLIAHLAANVSAGALIPGAAGGYVRSNGAAWVRVSGLASADITTATLVADLLFTDATFDIGKSGATRPRDGFFSRNVVVGGTLNVSGATSLGAVSALGTVSADLLFTDATFDIGKSAATRPRDGFFSRNVVIGGTLNVTGAITGSLTGNASTATTLQTARKINGNSFNGSASVDSIDIWADATNGATVSCPWYGVRPYYPLQSGGVVGYQTALQPANVIVYTPFSVARDCTIDELGFFCTTLVAAGKGRVGLYTSHATNFGPDQLIVDAGEQSLAATGLKITTGLSIALKRGVQYWAAYTTPSGTTTRNATCRSGSTVNAAGYPVAIGSHLTDCSLRESRAYAALPATATPTSVADTTGGVTVVVARFSA
jgi:hypothetical protein